MPEVQDVFRMATQKVRPDPGFVERQRRQQHLRSRNRKIGAFAVAAAIGLTTAVLIVSTSPTKDVETPAVKPTVTNPTNDGPSYTLGPVTEGDIAVGDAFSRAWLRGDGEAAAAMFSPKGTFDGFRPAILPALHDWFRAVGWSFEGGWCGIHGYGPRRGVVGCGFSYENDLTRALDMPPVDTTLSFVVDAGRIETAWYGAGGDVVFDMFDGYRGREDVFGPVWNTLIDWISSRNPEDFARMYDPGRGYPILDLASIELWDRYLDAFVASPQAGALALSIREAGWDGVGVPPEGTAPSAPELGEVVAKYFEGYGPIFVYVYADGRVITQERAYDFVTERRLTPEGVELVRSGVIEARDLLGSGYDIPSDAWEQREIKPFVPSQYAVCYFLESGEANSGTVNDGYEYPSRVIGFFAGPARAILLGELTHGQVGNPISPVCSRVSTDEARALVDILSAARIVDAEGGEIIWELNLILPHGVQVGHCSPPCG